MAFVGCVVQWRPAVTVGAVYANVFSVELLFLLKNAQHFHLVAHFNGKPQGSGHIPSRVVVRSGSSGGTRRLGGPSDSLIDLCFVSRVGVVLYFLDLLKNLFVGL